MNQVLWMALNEKEDVSLGLYKHGRLGSVSLLYPAAEFGLRAGARILGSFTGGEKPGSRRTEKSLAGGPAHFSQA